MRSVPADMTYKTFFSDYSRDVGKPPPFATELVVFCHQLQTFI
jgi:hypothetical protein